MTRWTPLLPLLRLLAFVLGAALAALALPAAAADDAQADQAKGYLPLWEAGLGGGLMSLPHYRGAGQSRTWLLPLPYVVYRGDILKADREGARAELLKAQRWHVDLSVAAGAPTRSQDNVARSGMRDLAPTLEFGPNINARLMEGRGMGHAASRWTLEARLPIRGALTLEGKPRWVGLVASPNLAFDWQLNHVDWGDWQVGTLLAAPLGSRQQHAYYYDVPAAQATATRPAYASRSGFSGLQWVGGFSRRVGPLWVGAFVKHDRLDGAVFADSPLVRRRSTTAYGVGLSWVFAQSSRASSVLAMPADPRSP